MELESHMGGLIPPAKATRIGAHMVGQPEPQSSEATLPAFADMIPQIVWEARPDDSSIDFNQQWYEYTGLTRESSVGTGWTLAIHPDDREPFIDRWQQTTKAGQPFEIEYRLRGAKGHYRWFLNRAVPRRDHKGEIVAWVATSIDFDDQRRGQREFERSEGGFAFLRQQSPTCYGSLTVMGLCII